MDNKRSTDIAKDIKDKLPDGHGFVLFSFPFHGQGENRLFYISNAERETVIEMLKEWLYMQGNNDAWMRHIK
jgi:hypothetical protein